MSYSNDYNEIKNGLNNYIHSLLKACYFQDEKVKKQFVIASLTEASLDIASNTEDQNYLYTVKPLIRANIIILKTRITNLQSAKKIANNKSNDIDLKIQEYNQAIVILENLIKIIN